MTRFACVSVLAVLLCAAGCGSSSSPSSPSTGTPATPAPPTTATSTTTTTSGLFTFTFEAGTLVADQDLVRNALTSASSFMQSALGRNVTQPTTITLAASNAGCVDPGASAFTGPRSMVICGANGGWTVHNTLNRQKILTHEAFHLVQFEMRWLGNANPNVAGPQWIIEGAAENLGWRGVASQGLVAYDTARGCNVRRASDKGAPASASLDTMETPQGFGVPWGYELGMLGIDQLTASAGVPSIVTFGNALVAGVSVSSAFQSAFGVSQSSFYAGFPNYRASLSGLSSTACGT